ncbi:hypothetical protein Bbelb_211640 [Branchiostoma belcheri]|nr:hypothetical protein Bbelb_211640 [Branchiostoma belcheri]
MKPNRRSRTATAIPRYPVGASWREHAMSIRRPGALHHGTENRPNHDKTGYQAKAKRGAPFSLPTQMIWLLRRSSSQMDRGTLNARYKTPEGLAITEDTSTPTWLG